MARVTPKTTWVAGNVPEGPDFNRIEGNTQQAFDEIDTEVQDRIDDVNAEEARAIADVDAEESRAIAAENAINADLGGMDFVNGNAGAYSSKTFSTNETWVIPKGLYVFDGSQTGNIWFQIYDGSNFIGFQSWYGGMVLSDGVNYRFIALNVATPGVLHYRKLA